MRKIKIKKQNGIARKKKISIRKKRMEYSDEAIYPFLNVDFPVGFPVSMLYKLQKRV